MKKKLQLNKETMAVLNMSEMSKVVGQADVVCPDEGEVLLPNLEDCSLFWRCVWGVAILLVCPAGLLYNVLLQICDYPENSKCRFTSEGNTTCDTTDMKSCFFNCG